MKCKNLSMQAFSPLAFATAMLAALSLLAASAVQAVTVNVVNNDGGPVNGFRWILQQDATYPVDTIGNFDTQLVEVFWEGFAATAGANVHAILHHGHNAHHIAEAIFKGLARSIRMALENDPRQQGIPSTKGSLTV